MKHLEDNFHRQIAQYLFTLDKQGVITHFTYNASGELRTKKTGALLKAKGVQKRHLVTKGIAHHNSLNYKVQKILTVVTTKKIN